MDAKNNVNRVGILIKCCIIMACAGLLYSVSVFVKPLATFHGWEVGDTALVGSTQLLFWPIGALLGGNVLAKYGAKKTLIIGSSMFGGGLILSAFVPSTQPWMIYVTYSAIAGLGNGFAYTGATFTANSWYPDKKGFATGVCIAVYGGASAFLAPLATKLIQAIGINNTLIFFGAAFTIIPIIAATSLKQAPEGYLPEGVKLEKKAEEESKLESLTVRETVKTKSFWFLNLASAFYPSLYLIMFPLFVVFITTKSLSPETGAIGVSIYSISSMVGRFVMGSLQDKIGYKKVYTLDWLITMTSIPLMIFGNSAAPILLAYACIGYGHGPTTVAYTYVSAKIFGQKYAGAIYGNVLMGYMVWTQVVPRLSKALIGSTGNYTASFILAGVLCTIAMISMWFVNPVERKIRANI